MRNKFARCVFAAALVLGLVGSRLYAQTPTTGAISGVVTDPSGAAVPKASVTLKSLEKAYTRTAITTGAGEYLFAFLDPGTYTLSVEVSGFQPASRTAIAVLGQVTAANIKLFLAAQKQVVEVTAAVPLVQTETGNTATTLTATQVSQVPNPGNDLSYIGQFSPGAQMNTQGGFGNFAVFGLPATSNLFTFNGMDNNDPFLNLNNSGATNLLLGQSDVQEVTVVTNAYSAVYGGLAGANVNYVTKSGANGWHGNALWLWNGSALNANNFFNNQTGTKKPFGNVNQYAASIGGPLKHDKLFFFLDAEGIRIVIPTNNPVNIPTSDFEVATLQNLQSLGLTQSIPFYCQNLTLTSGTFGTFACPPSSSALAGQGVGMFNLFNGAAGAQGAQNILPTGSGFDPSTGFTVPVATGNGCGTFTGNSAFFGAGALPCALQFRSTVNNFTYEWQVVGRMDYNIGPKDQAFVQMTYDVGRQATHTDPFGSVFNAQSYQPQYFGQINWTHTFNPTFTSQFILSGAHYQAIFDNANKGQTNATFPFTLLPGDGTLGGFDPFIGAFALNSEAFIFPQGRNVTQYGFTEDLSKTLGAHTIKFGAKFSRHDIADHDYGFFQSPLAIPLTLDAIFQGGTDPAVFTTDPLPDFSVLEEAFARSLNQPMALYSMAGYIEDDWRAKSNLTLNFGLRVEHDSNPLCRHLCFARLAGPFNQVSHDVNQPYNQAIVTPLEQAFQSLDDVLLAPRFGFAWQPFRSRQLVVRGGVGLFYDAPPNSTVDSFSQNPPLDPLFIPFLDNLAPSQMCGTPPNQVQCNLAADAAASNVSFQTGFVTGQTLAQIQAANPFFSPPSITVADRQTSVAQFQKWNLEIQYGLGRNTVFSVNYVGNHGVRIPVSINSANAFGFATLPSAPPDARFGEVTTVTNAGVSNYNGLVLTLHHNISGRFGSGVVEAHYTWSHALDEISNGGFLPFNLGTNSSLLNPQDPNNLRGMYGSADYDARHSFNMNYVWELPIRKLLFGHGLSALVDGWQISGAVFARTGFPYTVVDPSFAGSLNSTNFFGPIFPSFLGGAVPSCGTADAGPSSAATCLSTSQFTASGSETGFGPPGLRNLFRGPSYVDTDFAVKKATRLHLPGFMESAEFDLGFQFFNFLNHPNFDQPVASIASPNFGHILKTVSVPTSVLGAFLGGDASPRIIQLKAEFKF